MNHVIEGMSWHSWKARVYVIKLTTLHIMSNTCAFQTTTSQIICCDKAYIIYIQYFH